jgi:hypothetical protein
LSPISTASSPEQRIMLMTLFFAAIADNGRELVPVIFGVS